MALSTDFGNLTVAGEIYSSNTKVVATKEYVDTKIQELKQLFDGHKHKWAASWGTNPYGG
jgi:hypothetical protein